MVRDRKKLCLLACLMVWAAAAPARAADPTVEQMLAYKPRQPDVLISTPSGAELAGCKVELVKGTKTAAGHTPSGWVLKDSRGRMLRRFYDSTGVGKGVDIWSYYLNGEECYREVDTNLDGKIDLYRWLGPNGSKIGIDERQTGKITRWDMISVEEASQELLQAILKNDFPRFQALLMTEADYIALELPGAEVNRLKNKTASAGNHFQTAAAALLKAANAKWVHLDAGVPQCIPADVLGGRHDLIHHRAGTILYSNGEKDHGYLQTGEVILVGRAWKLTEGPVLGADSRVETSGTEVAGDSPPIIDSARELLEKLKQVDEAWTKNPSSEPAKIISYNTSRAEILEKITAEYLKAKLPGEEWIKQTADCYSTAAQNGDLRAMDHLEQMLAAAGKLSPTGNLTAYIAYREMTAKYSLLLAKTPPAQMQKLQEQWREQLMKFAEAYPAAEDAPEVYMQLGMVNEFMGKDTDAKNWYGNLAQNFKANPMAKKAAGAHRRLGLEGTELVLTGNTLQGGPLFNINTMKGKVVVVYYWASWNSQSAPDFAGLKKVMATYKAKGVELVCVNLDRAKADATGFLQQNPVDAIHLFEEGGLDSPLAVNYGIMVLPTLFLVDNTGKVLSRTVQVATLEDELKKVFPAPAETPKDK